jgi:hypothetical protein
MSRKLLNASEMGKRGGKKLAEMKQGTTYYADISKKGRETLKKKDPEFYQRLAAQGFHTQEVKRQTKIAKELGERLGDPYGTTLLDRVLNIVTD